ncbi:MAG TPA: pyridoxamine 5'-phosphate oxidase family protein [Dehalococcoidia bacterium]|nr:pyridoxamine 5'-phosphate oxidase family protein [Dehalococcoidia bacterium]
MGLDTQRRFHIEPSFDLDEFLARPLVAHVATNGPAVRPVWYIWEEGAFWWLTGPWSRLEALLREDDRVALVVDVNDVETGEVLKVSARGRASVVGFDADRARRKLARYLGPDESKWDRSRFVMGTFETPGVKFVRFEPESLSAKRLSYQVSGAP